MIGEPVYVFIESVREAGFERCDRLGVKRSTRPQQHCSVGDLPDEFVLERVIRSDTLHFPQEICSLQRLEVCSDLAGSHFEHPREQCHRNVRADHGGSLQQGLRQSIQLIDAGGQNGMDGLRDLNAAGGLAEAIISRFSLEVACLRERLNQFLEK